MMPHAVYDLFELWTDTSAATEAGHDEVREQAFLMLVAPWRVVGIPKKDENESRPIGVASVLLRLWMSRARAPTLLGRRVSATG